MKFKNLIFALVSALTIMSFTYSTVEYKVDKQKSTVTWTGSKVTGSLHKGTISVSDGKFTISSGKVTAGSFDMDMTSIKNTDLTDAGYNEKLIGHLKSDDFFSTERFPKASLVITKLTSSANNQYAVIGNLTIKGITKEIAFPATIQVVGKQIKAQAKITVDRAKYDVKYGSGSFFDNLGDKAISDNFILDVDLVANK